MIRKKLFKVLQKFTKIIFFSPRVTSSIIVIFVFVLVSIATGKGSFDKPFKSSEFQTRAVAGDFIKEDLNPTATSQSYVEKKSGISGEVSEKKIAPESTKTPDSNPSSEGVSAPASSSSGSSDLLSSVNSFRSVNGVAPISSSGSLCDVAGKRLNELIALGSLDNHAGFNKFFQGQSEFNSMGEIIFFSSNVTSPDYAVNEGWAKSTSGHRENMLDSKWNYGCGATDGHFAVFNFGKK